MKKQETYLVTFGDTTKVYTEKELQNFIAALVHNKTDIIRFSVERVDDPAPAVKKLLNDSRARVADIDAETAVIEAGRILTNLNDVVKLLGYE